MQIIPSDILTFSAHDPEVNTVVNHRVGMWQVICAAANTKDTASIAGETMYRGKTVRSRHLSLRIEKSKYTNHTSLPCTWMEAANKGQKGDPPNPGPDFQEQPSRACNTVSHARACHPNRLLLKNDST
ncbi:hypothetical protein M404DRAFT_867280 [Pisolithus tinctorius Marx 270]|uniref:Uncharacterized protein n=1 Tax=Pisolithus tinctorius Marx 270 TaxID=870435 RepID=A0A0C3N9X7_PISTI|nr:hypothetical protein M404DRAFT_867280 [Pisolithus tinctorius Marx 270]